MFRKLALTLAATAALGTASLAVGTSSVEAKPFGYHKHHHGHHHHWRAHRFYGPAFVSYAAYGGCYVKRWVATPWGYKVRWVNRCF